MGATKKRNKPKSLASDHVGARILGQAAWKRYAAHQAAQLAKTQRKHILQFANRAKLLAKQAPIASPSIDYKVPTDYKDWMKRRKSAPVPHSRPPAPPKPGQIDVLFVRRGAYTLGTPNPVYFDQPPYSRIEGIGSTTVLEYADPLTGSISLAFIGGNQFYTDGTLMMSSPLPEQFAAADGISIAASIFDVADITNVKKNTNLSIEATLYCPVRDSNPNDLNESINGLYSLYPGLATAPLSGLVAVQGFFDVTASSVLNGQVVGSNTSTLPLFERVMNNGTGPGYYGAYFKILVDNCVFTEPATVGQIVGLSTSLHIAAADHLIIQAQVRIQGLRGGVESPQAGYVGAKFQQISKTFPTVDIGAYGYACPFQVSSIAAFIT